MFMYYYYTLLIISLLCFISEVKKKKQELSECVRDMCKKELQYLDERSEFWRQQKSPQVNRHTIGMYVISAWSLKFLGISDTYKNNIMHYATS